MDLYLLLFCGGRAATNGDKNVLPINVATVPLLLLQMLHCHCYCWVKQELIFLGKD